MRDSTTEELDQRVAVLDRDERRCVIHFLHGRETDHVSTSAVVSHLRKRDKTSNEHATLAIDR